MKLFDSELKIMEILWRDGDLSAGQLASLLKEETGWNRNTTYTIIKKCIQKGAIERKEPNYICSPVLTREESQNYETEELIDKLFDGSREKFFAAFLNGGKLTIKEVEQLKTMIEGLKEN